MDLRQELLHWFGKVSPPPVVILNELGGGGGGGGLYAEARKTFGTGVVCHRNVGTEGSGIFFWSPLVCFRPELSAPSKAPFIRHSSPAMGSTTADTPPTGVSIAERAEWLHDPCHGVLP